LIAALWNMNTLRTYTKRLLTGLSSSTFVIILLFAVSLLLAKLASQAFHLPHYVQSIGEMTLINGCMILYIIMRLLKKERR
jgi:hypothetical protein